ncbi:Uroporphyrinogen decarboxylase [Halotydeus destructor]|nr:Uroporphyrinogen decarboxylase [Halotydeus destructor]
MFPAQLFHKFKVVIRNSRKSNMDIVTDFAPLKNDIILKAALGEDVPYVPVWLMRQAGRYLPGYKEIRSNNEFFEICRTPELACRVALEPLKRFNLDAAIIFSDTTFVAQALGMEAILLGDGPNFTHPLKTPQAMTRLKENVDVKKELKFLYDTVTLTRRELNGQVPLIGYTGGPWSLMAHMIEGKVSKTQSNAKKWLYKYPEQSHQLLAILAKTIIDNLVEQVKAGAQMLQVLEPTLNVLPPALFEQFVQPCLLRIASEVKQRLNNLGITRLPISIYLKDAHNALEAIGQSREYYDVISIDWTLDPKQSRSKIGPGVTLQGNLDPCAFYGDADTIDKLVVDMLNQFGKRNYIANLGLGMCPTVDPESVNVFVNSVHKHSQNLSS